MTYPRPIRRPIGFTPEDYAIFNYVWELQDTDKRKLDRYFMLRTTVGEFNAKCNIDADGFEVIEHQDIIWRVNYKDYGSAKIEEIGEVDDNKQLLVSFRFHDRANVAIAIVAISTKPEGDLDGVKELWK